MKNTNRIAGGGRWLAEWIVRLAAPKSTYFSPMTHGIENVLNYLRDAAGFAIAIKPNVPFTQSQHREVGEPENEEQALTLLRQAMTGIGCTVLRKGRLLTIVTAHEAKKHFLPLPTLAA